MIFAFTCVDCNFNVRGTYAFPLLIDESEWLMELAGGDLNNVFYPRVIFRYPNIKVQSPENGRFFVLCELQLRAR